MKLNLMTVCGAFASWLAAVHGEVPHRFEFSSYVVTDAIGTLRPMPGMAKVCCTEQFAQLSNVVSGVDGVYVLPLKNETFSTSPTVPETLPQSGLRSGVHPS